MFVPWAGGEEPSPVPQGVGDFLFKACGRASKSLAFPTQLLAVPLGCPCPRSCLDTGFSFEISRNWGWSSSRGCRGSAQSLSMRVWRFLGWDFKAGFFLRLKPAHFRPPGAGSTGKDTQSCCCHLLWILCCAKCQRQELLPLVFPYFLKLSLHISRLIKPSSAGSSLPHQPGHSCIQVQGCPPETSWVSSLSLHRLWGGSGPP